MNVAIAMNLEHSKPVTYRRPSVLELIKPIDTFAGLLQLCLMRVGNLRCAKVALGWWAVGVASPDMIGRPTFRSVVDGSPQAIVTSLWPTVKRHRCSYPGC